MTSSCRSSASLIRTRPPVATQAPVRWLRSCGAAPYGICEGADAVRPRRLAGGCGGRPASGPCRQSGGECSCELPSAAVQQNFAGLQLYFAAQLQLHPTQPTFTAKCPRARAALLRGLPVCTRAAARRSCSGRSAAWWVP